MYQLLDDLMTSSVHSFHPVDGHFSSNMYIFVQSESVKLHPNITIHHCDDSKTSIVLGPGECLEHICTQWCRFFEILPFLCLGFHAL